MHHPDERAILRYVSGQASGDDQLSLDEHMADCSACLGRVRALVYLHDSFDSIWSSWTAAEHGRVYRQWRVAEALGRVAEASPSLATQAARWLRRLGEAMDVAVEVLVDRARKIALAGAGELPPGYQFKLRPALCGVGTAEELAKIDGHLRKGSELLSQGRTDEAVGEVVQAAEIDARSPQTATSEVLREGRRVLQVVANSRRRTVSVRYWPVEGEAAPALALLLPKSAEALPLASEFAPLEDADYLLAEFEDVPSGPFTVRFGPILGER